MIKFIVCVKDFEDHESKFLKDETYRVIATVGEDIIKVQDENYNHVRMSSTNDWFKRYFKHYESELDVALGLVKKEIGL